MPFIAVPTAVTYSVASGQTVYFGVSVSTYTAALQFNFPQNSQYLALLRALGVMRNG